MLGGRSAAVLCVYVPLRCHRQLPMQTLLHLHRIPEPSTAPLPTESAVQIPNQMADMQDERTSDMTMCWCRQESLLWNSLSVN